MGWGDDSRTLFGPGVEVKYVDDKTPHFDLDLRGKISYRPDPEVDVDFDLVLSCDNGAIKTEIKNLKFEVIDDIIGGLIEKGGSLLGTAIGTRVGHPAVGAAVGTALSKYLLLSLDDINFEEPVISRACESIKVTPNGDITIRYRQPEGRN